MSWITVEMLGRRRVLLMDSIAHIDDRARDHIVVSGSHGGRSSAGFALGRGAAICFMNDAGVGKDEAGIVGLQMLQDDGVPAAAYDYRSARIGDAADAWENGMLSFVNAAAAQLGFAAGQPLREAVRRIFG
ncbi:MAG: hypothetical protein AB7L76_22335 [Burkholderiaceae bacterium]